MQIQQSINPSIHQSISVAPSADRRVSAVLTLLFAIPTDDQDQLDFNRLPLNVRADIDRTLLALEQIHLSPATQSECKRLALTLSLHRPITWHNLRKKYYRYTRSGDWRSIADWTRVPKHSRPGGATQSDHAALPPDFLEYLKGLMGSNQRKSEPAIRKLYDLWHHGQSIPGYGTWQEWFQTMHPHEPLPLHCPPDLPRGWSRANLRRHIPHAAELALTRHGISAARKLLPDILTTRDGLRPLEYIMFDDVRTDFRILVPGFASPVELNLLVALDVATGVILRYGLRPAIPRDDGMADRLKLKDMKSLVAGLLQAYGIPRDYPMNLIVENATAAIKSDFEAALKVLGRSAKSESGPSSFPSLSSVEPQSGIVVHRTEMLCGTAIWAGYKDRNLGNPGGKAALESTFNLLHNEAAFLPGQTGRRYDAGPAELHGRTTEAVALARTAKHLTPHQRAELRYPFLNYSQARLVLTDLFNRLCTRTDHEMEGFQVIGEWREREFDQWRPESELSTLSPLPSPILWRNPPRKESPSERWSRLMEQVGGRQAFTHLHPSAIALLYEEQKIVNIINGEILFKFDKEHFVYRVANAQHPSPLLKQPKDHFNLLAWFDPCDLAWIHLTDQDRAYLGSIPQTKGARRTDPATLKTEHARKHAELQALQSRVTARLPELADQRLADLDHNTQVLSDALANADAIDDAPDAPDAPTFVNAINHHKHTRAVAARQAAAEDQRIATAPRSLKEILAGHTARNESTEF